MQVLDEALHLWGLACVALASRDARAVAARASPVAERGFLCNLDKHWLALRRIGAEWWNFNSLLAAPGRVSDTYLRELLAQLQAEGYTVFVVHGEWPQRNALYGDAGPDGAWLTRSACEAATAEAARSAVAGRARSAAENALQKAQRGGGTLTLRAWDGGAQDGEDAELRRALAASLGEDTDAHAHAHGASGASARSPIRLDGTGAEGEDAALARAIAASLDEPRPKRHLPSPPPPPPQQSQEDDGMDPELAAALAASMADTQQPATQPASQPVADAAPAEPADALPLPPREPDAGEAGCLQLALRLPSGARLTRRFLGSDTLAAVAAVAAAAGADMRCAALTAGYPPRALAPLTATLAELGVTPNSVLSVQPK
jgi:ataxin-3